MKNTSMGITNVMGPIEQMALANHPVKGLYFVVTGAPQVNMPRPYHLASCSQSAIACRRPCQLYFLEKSRCHCQLYNMASMELQSLMVGVISYAGKLRVALLVEGLHRSPEAQVTHRTCI